MITLMVARKAACKTPIFKNAFIRQKHLLSTHFVPGPTPGIRKEIVISETSRNPWLHETVVQKQKN